MNARRWAAVGAVAVTGLLLSGCESGPVTRLSADDPSTARVGVVLTGEAAAATDAAGLDQLRQAVERIAGVEVETVTDTERVEVWASVPVERLPDLAGYTGVSAAATSTDAAGLWQLTVILQRPEELEQAVVAAVQDGVPGDDLDRQIASDTALDFTTVTVTAELPGDLVSSDVSGEAEVRDAAGEVTLHRNIRADAATWVVTAQPSSAINWPLWGGVLLLFVGVAGVIVQRRRNS